MQAQRVAIPLIYGLSHAVENLIFIHLLPVLPSCAGFTNRWIDIFRTIFEVMSSDAVKARYGVMMCFSTDCEQLFIPMFKLMRSVDGQMLPGFHEEFGGKIYAKTLYGAHIVQDFDLKHLTKKFRTSFLNNCHHQ